MSIIRRNVTACLLELSEADCVSELSPDEEEMLEEYEASCEKEELKVGTTEDGFHYLVQRTFVSEVQRTTTISANASEKLPDGFCK